MKLKEADVIYYAIETPENEDGSANLTYAEDMATTSALTAKKDTIVVTKSTVPVGTNDRLLQIIDHNKLYHINIEVVSKLEFLSFRLNEIEQCASAERKTLKPHFYVSLGRG